MARKARRMKRYPLVKTGTESMGTTGDQQYLGRVACLEPQIMAAYVHNIIVSCQNNVMNEDSAGAAFTVYLTSCGPVGSGGLGWSDDKIITARSTGAGGGTVNLTVKRRIQTNDFTEEATEAIGPVHIWAEMTDLPQATQEARFTIEAWGSFHTLPVDFA